MGGVEKSNGGLALNHAHYKQPYGCLDMTQYQQQAEKTAILPDKYYLTLGLCGEAGEVAELVKKAIRDHGGEIDKEKLKHELGDVLWYLTMLGQLNGLTLNEIAEANLAKLKSRYDRNKIQGSGDDR